VIDDKLDIIGGVILLLLALVVYIAVIGPML